MSLVAGMILFCYLTQTPSVEVRCEEDVYTIVSPNNGSGPLWSYGCTPIVRYGDDVFVSQMETGKDVPRLCNTRWILRRRTAEGWPVVAEAEGYRQREPTSLGVLSDGTLLLNVNDSTMPPGTEYGPCNPHLLTFSLSDPAINGQTLAPQWVGTPKFTDHSYRGYSVDSSADQILMMNIDAETSVQNWSWMNAKGETLSKGQITFPIRSCYPQVALMKGAAHVMAIGDIVEPIEEWRNYKFEQTNQKWDYVFRILHYAYTPDIAKQDFAPPIEIANVDKTAGAISNQDMWIAPDASAYLIYTEREVQSTLMRDKFFPDKSILGSLWLAIVKDGQVVSKQNLIPGAPEREVPSARFHETPDGTLYAVLYTTGADAGNKLMRIYPKLDTENLTPIPLKTPFSSFTLASVRAGCKPSNTIDIFGHAKGGETLSYAQVVLR
ncbi:MAG: hypothetical protein K1Y02_24250 [Candidatus Hydrogenedentes bacterium]|nr:hypothetical protein [Candidatus Hydrogenedentota bacterium]